MSDAWESLLEEEQDQKVFVLPWYGGRKVHTIGRTWNVVGPLPPVHGWHSFSVRGRACEWEGQELFASPPRRARTMTGYMVGGRFIEPHISSCVAVSEVAKKLPVVRCPAVSEEWLNKIKVYTNRDGEIIYFGRMLIFGVENEVRIAHLSGAQIDHLPGVTPALETAYNLAEYYAAQKELLRLEEEKRRQEEERIEQAAALVGTSVGRRTLSATDFDAAARSALAVSGAVLLYTRDTLEGEKAVAYQFREHRLECVVSKDTLAVLDAGVCLTDEVTGERGDRYFTLESLPGVISEAIDQDVLVVWRHP